MIFLPNNFELYTCALRNTVQLLILKNGYTAKYLNNLMKIHRAEALFSDQTEPLNIKAFSNEILKAAFLKLLEKNKSFHFKLKETGVFIINKKLYSSLLLTLCKTANKIEVGIYKEKILLTAQAVNLKDNIKLLKALDANYFFETKTRTLSVLIAAQKTNKPYKENEKDWEYILNPLSIINIYLN